MDYVFAGQKSFKGELDSPLHLAQRNYFSCINVLESLRSLSAPPPSLIPAIDYWIVEIRFLHNFMWVLQSKGEGWGYERDEQHLLWLWNLPPSTEFPTLPPFVLCLPLLAPIQSALIGTSFHYGNTRQCAPVRDVRKMHWLLGKGRAWLGQQGWSFLIRTWPSVILPLTKCLVLTKKKFSAGKIDVTLILDFSLLQGLSYADKLHFP